MAVEHDAITDPEIHEPKGASTAAENSIYVSDGAGSGSWRRASHSHFYYTNIGTGTTITTPTSYTVIAPTTVGDSDASNFTHSGTGRLSYTGTPTTDFTIAVTITFKHSTGAGVDCYFGVHENGTVVTGGEHVRTADSANYASVSLIIHVDSVVTDDYFEIYCKCSTGNIIIHALNFDIVERV